MTMNEAILAMIGRQTPPVVWIGTVITGGSAPEVSVDGAALVTVQYLAEGLTLAFGDRVLLVRAAGNTWAAVTKVTTPTAGDAPVTLQFTPTHNWVKGAPLAAGAGAWTYQFDYISGSFPAVIQQGQDYDQAGGDDYTSPKAPIKWATVLYFGALSSLVPSGSTILSVSLAFTRNSPVWDQPALTYPKVYGNLYTAGSPPTSANPPTAVGGFGPLTGVAAIGAGQSTTIALPASWITAWLAGTITGLHLYSDQRADVIYTTGAAGDVQLIVTYQPPPPEPT